MFDSDIHKAVAGKDTGEKVASAKEFQIADRCRRRFLRARDAGHREYVRDAEKFENFYYGNQWDAADLAKLEAEGRPAVTINKILSTINTMSGEQRSQRVDLFMKPNSDASSDTAHVVTKLSMAIWEANNVDWVESQVFDDGLIRERGYFDSRINFDNNVLGEVEIKWLDPADVILSPDANQYAPATWDEVYLQRWLSLEDIEIEFGEAKKNEVMQHGFTRLGQDSQFYHYERKTFGHVEGHESSYELHDDETHDIREIRVVERQYYQLAKIFCLVDPATGSLRELKAGISAEEARFLGQAFGREVYAKTKKRLRISIFVDSVLLHDDWSIYRTMTITPFFPYFRPGRPFGPIRNLISPQELLNKTTSQELHIVNTTANSGWIIEKGSLTNMDSDELTAYGSKTGVVLEIAPGKRAPEKIKPNPIPSGLDRISLKSSLAIKEVSGVNDAMLGTEKAEVSGVALEQKETRALVQQHVILDNLKRTRRLLAQKILELIKDFYTEERLIMVADEAQAGEPREAMVINQQQPDGTVLNDVTQGSFDVVITTLPARDTFDDVQFAQMLNLRNVGVMIPDHRVVQATHLRHKKEIVEEIKDLQGLSEPSEQERQLAQFQQQINMMMAQLQVEKIKREVMQLQADATLKMAKAESESQNAELEFSKMELQMALEEKQAELRRQLAVLSSISKLDSIEAQGQMNLLNNLVNQQQKGDTNGRRT